MADDPIRTDVGKETRVLGTYSYEQQRAVTSTIAVEQPSQERSVQDLKPAAELSTQEIVKEARNLHEHFQQLNERFEQAPTTQRAEIRQEMEPLVKRERELREEYTGRLNPEISRDRAPEQQTSIGY